MRAAAVSTGPATIPVYHAPMAIETGDDYVDSLRGRGLRVLYKGEWIDEPVDHPVIRPSIESERTASPAYSIT